MGVSQTEVQETIKKGHTSRPVFTFIGVLTVIFALAVWGYTIFSYREHKSAVPEAAQPPLIIEQARTLSEAPETSLERAQQLVQQGTLDQALALMGSVARYAQDPALQARAVLMAGTVLETRAERSREAAGLFRYFISRYQNQPGLDLARYHLALLEIDAGRLASAESLLTAVLRDSPNSPVATSVGYVAAETAKVLAGQESSANSRVGALVASLLPTHPAAITGFALSLAIALLNAYIKLKDERRPYTVALVLLVVSMSLYSLIANQREKAKDIRQIASSSSQR